MELVNRKSVTDRLDKYCVLSNSDNYVEITSWVNEEGWDISFEGENMSLTHGQLEAINFLTRYLMYKNEEDEQ